MTDDISDNDKKNGFVHTVLKQAVYGLVQSTVTCVRYSPFLKVTEKKSEFKSNEIKRLIACWDMAFDEWGEIRESWRTYRDNQFYKNILFIRNVIFTIVDNDGAYLQLLYKMLSAWNKVKEDDKYLEDN